MHDALTNEDILRHIFDLLADAFFSSLPRPVDVPNPNSLASLLSAALTCRTFCTPALAMLWRRLDSILPLFKLFSSFRKVDDVYVLDGRVSSDELMRFREYGLLVRDLCHGAMPYKIDPLVFWRLSQLCRSPLLPCLRSLEWKSENSFGAEPLVFIVPTLVRVNLTICLESQHATALQEHALDLFLSAVVDEVPSLKHISICGDVSRADLCPIAGLKNLQSVVVDSLLSAHFPAPPHGLVTAEMYRAFTAMEHLVLLNIDIHKLPPHSLAPVEFKVLKNLTLNGGPLSHASRLLGTLIAPHLTTLDITVESRTGDDCSSLFNAIRFRSLCNLSVWVNATEIAINFPSFLAKDIFAGLLTLNQLLVFNAYIDHIIVNMFDDDVLAIAFAWPRVREMNFLYEPGENRPTLAGLASFARHCPALVSLSLPINTTLNIPLQPPIFSHRLNHFDLHLTSVPNPLETARVLDCLFPYLQTVVEIGERLNLRYKREVIKVIRFFRQNREDNAQRMAFTSGDLKPLASA